MQAQRIKYIKKLGIQDCLDFTVDSEDHNFYAEGVVVSNCYSYSYITIYTAFYKAKYPLQYFLACLRMSKYEQDPIQCITSIQNELPNFGIRLLPPDILKSKEDYEIEGNDIRMGLAGVKGLSDKALEKLKTFQSTVQNKFQLFQNLEVSKIPLNVCASLILSGCFDSISLGTPRSRLLLELEVYKLLTDKELNNIIPLGPQYNFDLFKIIKEMVEVLKDTKGKPLIKESRFGTIKRDYEKYKQKFIINSKHELLSAYLFEQIYLGYSYTTSLKDIYSKKCVDLSTIKEIQDDPNKHIDLRYRIVGQIMEIEKRVSREKKTPYLSILLKDDTGVQKIMMFSQDKIDSCREFNGKDMEEDDIVIVNGIRKKDSDMYFVESVSIQERPLIVKISELDKKQIEL